MNQMRNMYQADIYQGANSGKGAHKGMGNVMKNLSQDQRKDVSSMLQSMPQEERQSYIEQIKSLDPTSMSNDELYSSIMDILNPTTQMQSIITSTSIDTYA